MRTDRQTEEHDTLNSRFSQLPDRAQKFKLLAPRVAGYQINSSVGDLQSTLLHWNLERKNEVKETTKVKCLHAI
jgi:hypothetical protein